MHIFTYTHTYLSVKQYTSIPGFSLISMANFWWSSTGIKSPPYWKACTRSCGVCMYVRKWCVCHVPDVHVYIYTCLHSNINSYKHTYLNLHNLLTVSLKHVFPHTYIHSFIHTYIDTWISTTSSRFVSSTCFLSVWTLSPSPTDLVNFGCDFMFSVKIKYFTCMCVCVCILCIHYAHIHKYICK